MNQEKNSKFVPGLPDDDDNNTTTNENFPTANDSTINIFEGVAECTVNENDTFKSVKIKAKNLAQDNVQKIIAEYIRDFLKDRYLTLPDDETLSIANEISTIADVEYNVRDSDDDIVIRATVVAKLDDNDIMNYIIRFFKERMELKSQNEVLRKENEALNSQIDELKHQLSNSQQNNDKIFQELTDHERFVISKIRSDKAWELIGKNDYESAIKLCNYAIQLNQNNFYAYNNRGISYKNLGQYERAIQDFDKAIQINPNDNYAYNNRGVCYISIGRNLKAQDDFAKAKELGYKD